MGLGGSNTSQNKHRAGPHAQKTLTQPFGGVLAAGGSLEDAGSLAQQVSVLRRVLLGLEMVVLFVGLPLILLHVVLNHKQPLFVVLQPVLLAFVVFLLWDRTFLLRRELIKGFAFRDLMSILMIFLVGGGLVFAFVEQELPRKFMEFMRNRPQTWQRVMILYPLLSVFVQELVYRTFFFHRYGPVFGSQRTIMILTNGVFFGFAHILFENWVAVAGTAVIGTLLAYRYEDTRSFWAVWLEHTLWGWLVFTAGLGGYFFTGVSNFSILRLW